MSLTQFSDNHHNSMIMIYSLAFFVKVVILLLLNIISNALVPDQIQLTRRDVLLTSAATFVAGTNANAAETIDMDAINAARSKTPTSLGEMVGLSDKKPTTSGESVDMDRINAVRSKAGSPMKASRSIVPISDPGPLLAIRGGPKGKATIKIPRIGYSFYKTAPDQATRCANLALRSGVLHLDVGTQYNSNPEIAKSIKKYLDIDLTGLQMEEKPELLEFLDATRLSGQEHELSTVSSSASTKLSPAPVGAAGRRGRRERLFISHKISNAEQSTDAVAVRRAVKNAIAALGCTYLDMVSIHSPLTDSSRRLATYEVLLGMRDSGFVKTVGVCNYGLEALKEIAAADLDLPAVNQLELSPFNAHKDVVDWCDKYGIAVACGAWSRLSGADGPAEGWDTVSKIAQQKGMTKAQVLVRWSLQKGYVCVPRSASASKVERIAIGENSYGGVNRKQGSYVLSQEEMEILDDLDVSYRAGKLGRRDGWEDSDVTGPDWDPTEFV